MRTINIFNRTNLAPVDCPTAGETSTIGSLGTGRCPTCFENSFQIYKASDIYSSGRAAFLSEQVARSDV
jgi:hypothetical protein